MEPEPAGAARSRPSWRVEAALVLVTGLVCVPLLRTRGYEGDIVHVKGWSRRVTLDGLSTVYAMAGPYDVDYPPVTLYLDGIVGGGYRALADRSFDLERALASRGLTEAIKSIGVAFHLLGIVLLSRAVAAQAGAPAGYAAAAAYGLNPAVLYTVAHWGQPDPIHSFLLVLAVLLQAAGRPGSAGLAAGLALMTKPQAWVMLPLLVGAAALSGWRAAGRLAAGCAVGVLVPALPFLIAGTWRQLLDVPGRVTGWMPYVNAGAHNFWWLVTAGTNWERLWADEGLWGDVTYRQVALGLVISAAAFSVWLTRRRGLVAVAPYYAFAWYVLTVQAHENHSFFVLPLLAVTLHTGPWPRVAFAVVTVTLLVNLVLHSPEVWGPDMADFMHLQGARLAVSLANAAVNVLLLACWTVFLVRGDAPGRGLAGAASLGLVSPPPEETA
jgi:hypothetical protein